MPGRSAIADAAVASGQRPAVLCTLTLPDGRRYHLANRALELVRHYQTTEGPIQFHPLLSGVSEFVEEYDPFTMDGIGALTQARVELVVDDHLAELQEEWYHVVGATVEIALAWPGEWYEDRHVLLGCGAIQGIEFGAKGQTAVISIESSAPQSSETVGDDSRDLAAWAGNLDNGALAMTDLTGSKYQHVFGMPASVKGYKVGAVGASNRLILAGHHFAEVGAGAQVDIYENGAHVPGGFTVGNATAAGVGDYAYVEDLVHFASGSGAYTYQATYGSIACANDVTRGARTAGDVLRRLLADSGLPVDWRRCDPAIRKLSGVRWGFYADVEVSAIQLVRDRLVPFLPLVEMNSGEGIWFAFVDPIRGEIEADLVEGQQLLGPVGRMETSDLDIIRNKFVLRYDYDDYAGEYLSTATLDRSNDTCCYLSQQILRQPTRHSGTMLGVRADDPISCNACWDETTALQILRWRAARLALPRRYATFLAAPELYWLDVGSVVLLTSSTFRLNRVRAVVVSVNRAQVPHSIRFATVDRTTFSREDQ